MGQLANGSLAGYLTPAEFLDFKDSRLVGQLATDDGTELAPTEVLTDSRVSAALMAASGYVESSLLLSGRYSAEDVASLPGAAGQYIKKLVADVAAYMLVSRRGGPAPPETVLADYDHALKQLEELASGTRTLPFLQSEQAGEASNIYLTEFDYINQHRVTDSYQRVLGTRAERRRLF